MILYIQFLLGSVYKDIVTNFKQNNTTLNTIPDTMYKTYDKHKYCKLKYNIYCSFVKCKKNELLSYYEKFCNTE